MSGSTRQSLRLAPASRGTTSTRTARTFSSVRRGESCLPWTPLFCCALPLTSRDAPRIHVHRIGDSGSKSRSSSLACDSRSLRLGRKLGPPTDGGRCPHRLLAVWRANRPQPRPRQGVRARLEQCGRERRPSDALKPPLLTPPHSDSHFCLPPPPLPRCLTGHGQKQGFLFPCVRGSAQHRSRC